jgi:homogentisate phytyltransferase / homogentisate geranylgeranyltransferase
MTSTSAPLRRLGTLWAFSRPHTVIGTVVSVTTLWLLATQPGVGAVASDGRGATAAAHLVLALVGALATNVYIVGVNQLTDLDIDRINKPYLPLAAGTLTLRQGRLVVGGSLALALLAGVVAGPFLLAAFAVGVAVGSAYSLRPLRLKRFPFWAAASVSFVRGVVVNVLVYLHFAAALGGRAVLPVRIALLAAVVIVFGLVIAWFKDVPDMEGDRRFGIRTLTLRLGPRRVLAVGLAALAAAHGFVAIAAVVGIPGLQPVVLAVGAVLLTAASVAAARRIDPAAPATFVRFYLRIWALFYAEYLVFGAAGLLA